MKKIVIIISAIIIILLGIFIGVKINNKEPQSNTLNNNIKTTEINQNMNTLVTEVSKPEEKTTPNTLLIYKIYYTKCKHYIKNYNEIDASLVNLTQKEFKDKFKGWKIERFSPEEVEISKEEERFCNEHYKLKLEDNIIVIYNINENGRETEYERTDITTEYLTQEDILKLRNGIIVFGKENLTSTIEDYE